MVRRLVENSAEGTPERDALSQIDIGSNPVVQPGDVDFSVLYGPGSELQIDATADHATHFRELRKGPSEDGFIERAANVESPIHDSVALPGQ